MGETHACTLNTIHTLRFVPLYGILVSYKTDQIKGTSNMYKADCNKDIKPHLFKGSGWCSLGSSFFKVLFPGETLWLFIFYYSIT